jgi:hypothetical protein
VGKQNRIDVNWVQTLAGGLAAMSSAVLLSTVGAAGTIVGAALGSIAITVGSAVYSHYLAVSRERVAAARAAALQRAYRPRDMARVGSVAGTSTLVDQPVVDTMKDAPRRIRWREVAGGLGWKRIVVAALGTFVLVMGVILLFELSTGRTVSSYTGGSDADGARTSLSVLSGSSVDSSTDGGRAGDSKATDGDRQADQPAGTTARREGDGDTSTAEVDHDHTDVATEHEPGPPPAAEVPPQPEAEPTPQPSEEAEPTTPPAEPTPEPEPTTEPTAEPTTSSAEVQPQVDTAATG